MSPVTAAILGAVLLGETVTPATLGGLGFILIGLWLTQRPATLPDDLTTEPPTLAEIRHEDGTRRPPMPPPT